ncbi:MAG: hypothetical protein QXQ41_04890, partial [Candidatus Bathyarchaeia archaeon]
SLTRFAMFLILFKIVNGMTEIKIPWRDITKYVSASALMAFVLRSIMPQPTRLSLTLGITALGAIIYLTTLAVIDVEARSLVKSIFQKLDVVM